MSKRGYDNDSGQVYFDLTVSGHDHASDAPGPAWAHESPFEPAMIRQTKPSIKGAPSLQDMAIREFLADQRRLSVAHLEYLTWPVAERLWRYLCEIERNTLYMWKLYATAFPKDFSGLAPCHSFAPYPMLMPPRDYFNLISSNDMIWGTLLSISTHYLNLSELADIAKLANLTALELSSPPWRNIELFPPSGMTDRILRMWSELAASGDAFKHLRLLVLRSQTEVTERLFSYLNCFPSLVAVIIVGCPSLARISTLDVARVHGWKSRDVSATRVPIQKHFTELGFDKSEDKKQTLPSLDASLWGPNPSRESENRRWFTRQQPRALKGAPSMKRKIEPAVSGNAPRGKKPALRSLNKTHMKKSFGLVQEFLGGNPSERVRE